LAQVNGRTAAGYGGDDRAQLGGAGDGLLLVGEVSRGDDADVYRFEGVVFCGSGGIVFIGMTWGCDGGRWKWEVGNWKFEKLRS